MLAWARRAEDLGFESVWAGEHPGPDGPDPIMVLAALAPRVGRIRLGTLALGRRRNPAVMAKELATLDVIAQGRLDVGLTSPPGEGSGATRHLDETLRVLSGMFQGGLFTFRGSTVEVTAAPNLPPPPQRPRPPLMVMGADHQVLDLAGVHADGWISPWSPSSQEWRRCSDRLTEACDGAGRDPVAVTRSVALARPGDSADEIATALDRWRSNGASRAILSVGAAPFGAPQATEVDLVAAACSLWSP